MLNLFLTDVAVAPQISLILSLTIIGFLAVGGLITVSIILIVKASKKKKQEEQTRQEERHD